MKAISLTAPLLLATLLLTACQADLRELCYDHRHQDKSRLTLALNLKLDVDIEIEVLTEQTRITEPEYMKVCFYSPAKTTLQSTEFVSGKGGPLHTSPGLYDMVCYSFGTEYIQIRGEGDISTLEAFTSDITASRASTFAKFTRGAGDEAPGPIIYSPDHLLVARETVEIPSYEETGDQVITIEAIAATIVETYSFRVPHVNGVQYVESVEGYVTNQARSSFFGRGEVNTEPATICFPVETDIQNGQFKTSFNTFGKLPGESRSFLHIVIKDTGGKEYRISTDITDQFLKPDHEIIIDDEIDIPQPESRGGGIAPTVEPWQEETHDVPIG